ncbi:MAG: cysteine--tRNA ligase, partial [Akkermansiaceae bacterium]|nr:cysteine--tRNA ligase [Akkermansiaceae bacterium]
DAKAALARLARSGQALAIAAGKVSPPCYEEMTSVSEEGAFSAAWASLRDDLNTPEALGHLFSALKTLRPSEMDDATAAREWLAFHRLLAAFGLSLPRPEDDTDPVEIPAGIAALAEERWQARLAKDWAKSDSLRQQLADHGWVVKDGKDGYQLTRG